jgi:hypothetical protein
VASDAAVAEEEDEEEEEELFCNHCSWLININFLFIVVLDSTIFFHMIP